MGSLMGPSRYWLGSTAMARPRQHTDDDFVDAAIRIVDAEGLTALTARRLGRELGVSYTAVYTYFADRDRLMQALVDRVATEVIADVEAGERPVREELMAVATSARRALARHPQLASVFASASGGARQGNEATLYVVRLLERAELSGRDLVTAYRIIESYVFGGAVFDLGAAPEHLSIRRRRYALTGHPAFETVATSDEAVGDHNDEAFRRGLELILDGLGI